MGESVDCFSKFMEGLGQQEEAEKVLKNLSEERKEKTPFLLKLAEYQIERGETSEAGKLLEGLKNTPGKIRSDGQTIKAAKLFGRLNDLSSA